MFSWMSVITGKINKVPVWCNILLERMHCAKIWLNPSLVAYEKAEGWGMQAWDAIKLNPS
jgi:hypothetical protein